MVKQKRETVRVNLFLDPEIVEKAKIRVIKESSPKKSISLSKMVNKALSEYLKVKAK